MKNLLLFISIVAVGLVFGGCPSPTSSGPPTTAPRVESVAWSMIDYSESTIGSSSNYRSQLRLDVVLDDMDRVDEISSLKIAHSVGGEWQFTSVQVQAALRTSGLRFYLVDPSDTNRVALGDYEITIEADGLDSTTSRFTVYARGDTSQNSGFAYTGAAGGTPKICLPPSQVAATRDGDTIDLEFTLNDDIISWGFLLLYDASGSPVASVSDLADFTGGTLNTSGANTASNVGTFHWFEAGATLGDVDTVAVYVTDALPALYQAWSERVTLQ
ncbi:MAG: hypothetical protein ACOC2Q_00990 [Spirochaetota bacterium]